MARIKNYVTDNNVTGDDKWIGSDAGSFGQTKNFSPNSVAAYYNASGVLITGGYAHFEYRNDYGGVRPSGSITTEIPIPGNIQMSTVTTLKISKRTFSGIEILNLLSYMVGRNVMFSASNDPDNFAEFKLESLTQDVLEPEFYNATLTYVIGSGYFADTAKYQLSSYVNFDVNSVPHNTLQQVLETGNQFTDGSNIIIIEANKIIFNGEEFLFPSTSGSTFATLLDIPDVSNFATLQDIPDVSNFIEDAPQDSEVYGRFDGTWVKVAEYVHNHSMNEIIGLNNALAGKENQGVALQLSLDHLTQYNHPNNSQQAAMDNADNPSAVNPFATLNQVLGALPNGAIPSSYISFDSDVEGMVSTSSGTFVDVFPGATKDLTITNSATVRFRFGASFSATKSSGNSTVVGVRISRIVSGVPVESSIGQQARITNNNDIENGSIDWTSSALPPGTHTFRLQWRAVSGSGTVEMLRTQFGGIALQAPKGEDVMPLIPRREILGGAANGSNVNFTVSFLPTDNKGLLIIQNGSVLPESSYSVLNQNITFTTPPPNGAILQAYYYNQNATTIAETTIDGEVRPLPWVGGQSYVVKHGGFMYFMRRNNTTDFVRLNLTDYTYQTIASAPNTLQTSGNVGFDGTRYIYTGRGGTTVTNNFFRYDIVTNAWALASTLAATTFVRTGVFLGTGNGSNVTFNLWNGKAFNTSHTGTYASVTVFVNGVSQPFTMTPAPPNNVTGVVTMSSPPPNGSTVTANFTLRQGMGSATAMPFYNNELYCLFGDDSVVFAKYNITSNQWILLADSPLNNDWAAVCNEIVFINNEPFIYVLRGEDEFDSDKQDFWRYNINANTWSVMAPCPVNTDAGSCFLAGDWIVAAAGKGSFDQYLYHIPSNSWTKMNDLDLQMRRGSLTPRVIYNKNNHILVNYLVNAGTTVANVKSKWITLNG
jgi:hypothetical protein